MGGGNQVDVVTTDLLEVEHYLCQGFVADFFPPALMGDGPVLAEDAAEVAVGEKYGAGAVYSRDRFFFAKVGVMAENNGTERRPAETLLALAAIHPAAPRTELAILEDPAGLLNLPGEFPLFLKFGIGGLPRFLLPLPAVKVPGQEERRPSEKETALHKIPTREPHIAHAFFSGYSISFRQTASIAEGPPARDP